MYRESQRHAHSNRLEMDNVSYGYEESGREQARLHEELAQRVEELKRAQEIRLQK